VTPSHQFPTSATLSRERRHALLEEADRKDFLILEDGYEADLESEATLRSLDMAATAPMSRATRASTASRAFHCPGRRARMY
jgi:DNA-binding transcriptional MocR family regulator